MVLFGADDTKNTLDYDGINVLGRGLAQADWEIITYIREQETARPALSFANFVVSKKTP